SRSLLAFPTRRCYIKLMQEYPLCRSQSSFDPTLVARNSLTRKVDIRFHPRPFPNLLGIFRKDTNSPCMPPSIERRSHPIHKQYSLRVGNLLTVTVRIERKIALLDNVSRQIIGSDHSPMDPPNLLMCTLGKVTRNAKFLEISLPFLSTSPPLHRRLQIVTNILTSILER